MTLTIHDDLAQGSPEWHDVRRGIVTASVVKGLVTPSTIKPADNVETRALAAQLVAERITGFTDDSYLGADMERGWEDEPLAVEKYSEHYAPVTHVGFMVRDDWGFEIGYSPDGLVGNDGLIEVKSRRPKKHLQTILGEGAPGECMAQIQCGLLVSGRDWSDYVSYCGGMPLYVYRVWPDRRWFDAIVDAAQAFENAAAQMVALYRMKTSDLPTTERINHDLGLVF